MTNRFSITGSGLYPLETGNTLLCCCLKIPHDSLKAVSRKHVFKILNKSLNESYHNNYPSLKGYYHHYIRVSPMLLITNC